MKTASRLLPGVFLSCLLALSAGCSTSSGHSSVGYSVYAGYGYPYYGPGWGYPYPYPCCDDKPDKPNRPKPPGGKPDGPTIQPTENPLFNRPRPPSNIGRPATRPTPRPTPRPRPMPRRAR
jgi:hypothetical protein